MTDGYNNFIQVFNEVIVLICAWLMFHFTLYVDDAYTRYELARYFLYLLLFNVGVNVIFLFLVVGKKIYKAIKSFMTKRFATKNTTKTLKDNKIAEHFTTPLEFNDDGILVHKEVNRRRKDISKLVMKKDLSVISEESNGKQ